MTTRTSSFLAGLALPAGATLAFHSYLTDLVADTSRRLMWSHYLEIN